MKNSNIHILFKLFLIWITNIFFLQTVLSLDNPELYIQNLSSNERVVSVKIYPVSMTFNGFEKYDLLCANRENPPYYNFVNSNYGGDLDPNEELIYNHDFNTANNGNNGAIGFGIYKVFIRWGTTPTSFDTCTIEWDYGWAIAPPPFTADLSIFFRDNNNNPRVTFQWSSGTELRIDTTFVNKKIEAWKQYGIGSREKNFGDFQYIQQNIQATFPPERDYNYYLLFPQDSRRDCVRTLFNPDGSTYYAAENQGFDENRSGDLTLNLTIDKKVYSPDIYQMMDFPTRVNIKSNVVLKLNDNDTIDFTYVNLTEDPLAYFEMNVESNGRLLLNTNSRIILRSKNKLNLKIYSFLYLGKNSEIRVKPGAYLCNYGASIRGSGRFYYEGGFHQEMCHYLSDYLIQDSVKFILDTNATLPIPNNTTLHIKGITTSLIMNPGSKLLFGENSGIICDNGGKLIANNAVFASIDSTKKWNGISLSDLSQDTIKNCTIKNAMYGITVSEKYDAEDTGIPYSTEISGCSFVNQTNYVLNNGVYIAGSNNVLIMNNTVSSSSLEKGFTHGIYAEYCPDGDFNIIGNNIYNSGNGMTLIGCSPFVAQNILTGNQYSECGMFLDNSNGTFEYNEISDFYYSYFSFYSSPDLLKNIFDNYYDDNIWFSTSSVPVMHPLINSGSVSWYAGDNTIKGSPSDAGILFDEDARPLLDYGYNKFVMTNNDYYISGTNPSGGAREFYVIQNYWGGTPDSNKFNVVNADVVYIPYDNNSSSARETNSDEKFDIGFGLYDTVYYYESDNPNSAQDLYLEAYQKEYAGEYSQAIDIYKEIVEEYKDSSYTSSCISRIFSCFEKKNSIQSEYSSLENYYSNISSDTSYTEIQRNISEEFMIKSKVKQNDIEEAISDYNAIYTQNISTPKGTHAFINKEILSAGAGDNMINNSAFEKIELKLNALNHLFAKIIKKENNIFTDLKIKPVGFSLSQNYPNPFNPVTRIEYNIGKSGYVSLNIYDVNGRLISKLINQNQSRGNYSVVWNGIDNSGNLSSSGVYFYTLNVNGNTKHTKRMLLIK